MSNVEDKLNEARQSLQKTIDGVQQKLQNTVQAKSKDKPSKSVEPFYFVGSLSVKSQSPTRIAFEAEALHSVGGKKYRFNGVVSFWKNGNIKVLLGKKVTSISPEGKTRTAPISKTATKLFKDEMQNEIIKYAGELFYGEHQKVFEGHLQIQKLKRDLIVLKEKKHKIELAERRLQKARKDIQRIEKLANSLQFTTV